MEYELYYRFTCKKNCTDRTGIPIEHTWTKHFRNEDAAKAELENITEAKKIQLLSEYEECIGPVKYIKGPFSNRFTENA